VSRADAIRRLAENPGATPGERAAARKALERLAAKGEGADEERVGSKWYPAPTDAHVTLAGRIQDATGCEAYRSKRGRQEVQFEGPKSAVDHAVGLWRAVVPELDRAMLATGLGFVWGRFPEAPGENLSVTEVDLDAALSVAGIRAGQRTQPKLEGS
jgi:hypothetical protein